MDTFTKDFVEFIECCAAREVKFLIVGGYALAAHGHPRIRCRSPHQSDQVVSPAGESLGSP